MYKCFFPSTLYKWLNCHIVTLEVSNNLYHSAMHTQHSSIWITIELIHRTTCSLLSTNKMNHHPTIHFEFLLSFFLCLMRIRYCYLISSYSFPFFKVATHPFGTFIYIDLSYIFYNFVLYLWHPLAGLITKRNKNNNKKK